LTSTPVVGAKICVADAALYVANSVGISLIHPKQFKHDLGERAESSGER
jgi:hypothetical protein